MKSLRSGVAELSGVALLLIASKRLVPAERSLDFERPGRDSPEPQLQAVATLARRPHPEPAPAPEADSPDEDAGVVGPAGGPDCLPHVSPEHLEPVRLP